MSIKNWLHLVHLSLMLRLQFKKSFFSSYQKRNHGRKFLVTQSVEKTAVYFYNDIYDFCNCNVCHRLRYLLNL